MKTVLRLKCQGDPEKCEFNRASLEIHEDRGHTTYRCPVCKVTFEEWVVLQIRQLREPTE